MFLDHLSGKVRWAANVRVQRLGRGWGGRHPCGSWWCLKPPGWVNADRVSPGHCSADWGKWGDPGKLGFHSVSLKSSVWFESFFSKSPWIFRHKEYSYLKVQNSPYWPDLYNVSDVSYSHKPSSDMPYVTEVIKSKVTVLFDFKWIFLQVFHWYALWYVWSFKCYFFTIFLISFFMIKHPCSYLYIMWSIVFLEKRCII